MEVRAPTLWLSDFDQRVPAMPIGESLRQRSLRRVLGYSKPRTCSPSGTSLVFDGAFLVDIALRDISRFSSAVEQRFCKPKVGSSILSTGTTKILYGASRALVGRTSLANLAVRRLSALSCNRCFIRTAPAS
jgi:hypothetical protein